MNPAGSSKGEYRRAEPEGAPVRSRSVSAFPAEVPAPSETAIELAPMLIGDLDAVVEIERNAYAFPWTRGNFIDSLAAGYDARVLRDATGAMLGYWIAMAGVQEMHLLNITVAPRHQSRGYARLMLDRLIRHVAERGDEQLWLEVRPSNERARALYERYGFRQVGLRKGYYPALLGRREDALVMSLDLRGRHVHAD